MSSPSQSQSARPSLVSDHARSQSSDMLDLAEVLGGIPQSNSMPQSPNRGRDHLGRGLSIAVDRPASPGDPTKLRPSLPQHNPHSRSAGATPLVPPVPPTNHSPQSGSAPVPRDSTSVYFKSNSSDDDDGDSLNSQPIEESRNSDGKAESDRGVERTDLKRGYLTKRGAVIKNWKERYFVIRDSAVHYYKSKKVYVNGGASQGMIPIRGLVVKAYDEKDSATGGKKHCFGMASTVLTAKNRTFMLVATCDEERDQWIQMLTKEAEEAMNEKEGGGGLNPLVWEIHHDEGDIYYYHKETGESTWDRPPELEAYQYSEAARLFNQKPARGFDYLVEHRLARALSKDKDALPQPGDVDGFVRFFHQAKGLSKKVVGEIMGGEKPFNLALLKAYTAACNFKDMAFEEALRQYLAGFRLPGEAQKIDRIMQCFAERYHDNNATVFSCADTAYILAFSLIMLNTDAHNPSIPASRKMTYEQFEKNNRGIDRGKDMPAEFLRHSYDEIVKHEIKMTDGDQHHGDTLTFLTASKEGWLKKKGERGLQKRWFLLMDNNLYYFEKPDQVKLDKPKCIYPLEDIKVSDKDDNGILLETKSGTNLKSAKRTSTGGFMPGTSKSLLLLAKDRAERDEWARILRQNVAGDSFYHLISRKKIHMKM